MLEQVLTGLAVKPGGRYADGTLGGGVGHAAAILARSSPNGWLYGCDLDGAAVESARKRLSGFEGRFELRQGNFADLASWVPEASCDGVVLDLGISSLQLDNPERGLSFQRDGPLDMRLNREQRLTAAELVNTAEADELAKIFRDLGGEQQARRIARAIVVEREKCPFEATLQLAELIERLAPRRGSRTHPATRVFMALRMAVNDELGSLAKGLAGAVRILRPGGRLAVISFHSVEDRLVKDFGRARARDYTFSGGVDVPELREPRAPELRIVTRKAVKPEAAEIADNPRSRSGQLRLMEKI